ncbi:helix-turn-helix domain-containing protein [Mucilaginibacter sp. cycad4]|uniref:winged helix-turn-helix transcriptional regulator n=1 Tax=Mucilaginibacter sp. cycad4 TaxID=3342096 RepID=UPI002AAB1642|nr:helix-turn-helix domain-containing protein [Mucilaginibacter gossypii]WPU99059.1 helix-turn-helix domain-containing protein [Mucilaginibacter gossypii]
MEAILRSDCPISYALDLFGDKWSLLILRDIMFFDKHTYSEFLNSNEKIATNIARDRLVKLTQNGFISKGDNQQRHWNRPYYLTEKAISLVPVMADLTQWGALFGHTGGMEKMIAQFRGNRNKAIAQLQTRLREKIEVLSESGI